MMKFAKSQPYLFQFALSFAVGLAFATFLPLYQLYISGYSRASSVEEFVNRIFLILLWTLLIAIFLALFFVYPVVLLGYQLILFVRTLRWKTPQPHRPGYDSWVLGFLLVCGVLYLSIAKHVRFMAGWQEQLENLERHSPISPGYYPWVFILILLFMCAFYALSLKPADQWPPLVPVLAIGVLYIATVYVVLWTIQIFEYTSLVDLYMLIAVVVVVLIVARTIAITVRTHQLDVDRSVKLETNPILAHLTYYFTRAKTWPVLGFFVVLPVMGIVYAILLLLGQGPHALIRAFTDTSEWTLSQQTSPPNEFYDNHYLCTVAAGGHKKLVKPIRGGIRHGRPVIVNRQLLIANAFEQVISDRLPRTHRAIRHFYDRYGCDLAKRIRTKRAADIVWILMKPLEWIFLIVIYLCVRHPEDLIAMQYTGIYYRKLTDLDD